MAPKAIVIAGGACGGTAPIAGISDEIDARGRAPAAQGDRCPRTSYLREKSRDAERPARTCSHLFVDGAAANGLAEQPRIELDASSDRGAGLGIDTLVRHEYRLEHGFAIRSQRALHARGIASPCHQTMIFGQRPRFDEGYAIVFGPRLCVAAAIVPLVLS